MVDSQDCPTFTSDLLQQAFQEVMNDDVVDDENRDDDLASILGGVEVENSLANPPGKSITLTSAQAAALGLTFEADSPDVAPGLQQNSPQNSQHSDRLWGQGILLQNANIPAAPITTHQHHQSRLLAQEISPIVASLNSSSPKIQTTQVYQAIPIATPLQLGSTTSSQTTINNKNQIFRTLNDNIFTATPTTWKNQITKNCQSLRIKPAQTNHSLPRIISIPKNSNVSVPVMVNTNYPSTFKNKTALNSIPILKKISLVKVNGHMEQKNPAKATFSKSILLQNHLAKSSNVPRENFGEKVIPKTIDLTKPLGSTENPIQIVQQGKNFHSSQNLSDDKLKKIIQILQTRSQSAANTNEKIFYRLVFPEEMATNTVPTVNSFQNHQTSKRGRPRKSLTRHSTNPVKSSSQYEEQDESKEDRKKVVARTRSGRLSRPPRHMVRDYKHLRHVDSGHVNRDPGDSDGGYSDYSTRTNGERDEDESSCPKLLGGLEMPKRKISEDFRCPTCNKIYLGRLKMSRHFEAHPDHGSPSRLPSPSLEPKHPEPQDPLKRKGKKRGPWAYVTPEAKSERRQGKLKEAISVCEDFEIAKVAAMPVLEAMSMYKLLLLRSRNSAKSFVDELKTFLDDVRNNVGSLLAPAGEVKAEGEVLHLEDDRVREVLGGVQIGRYKLVGDIFEREQKSEIAEEKEEPAPKKPKPNDHGMECPEVLSALTLIPRIVESNLASSKALVGTQISGSSPPSVSLQKLDEEVEVAKEPSFTQVAESSFHPVLESFDANFHNAAEHYDHLDILNISMDDKMTDQLSLEQQSNIDDIMHERLNTILEGGDVICDGSQPSAIPMDGESLAAFKS